MYSALTIYSALICVLPCLGHEINSLISVSFLSVVVIAVLTVLLLFGVKNSSRFNLFITCMNLSIILFVIW